MQSALEDGAQSRITIEDQPNANGTMLNDFRKAQEALIEG
jgi:hypothetical protein